MAKEFLNEEFLLETQTARDLYNTAKNEPVYDYHCHLSPAQIAENINLNDLTDAWLSGDHYKWRMMRAMGIDERFITGNGDNYGKYLEWARTVENLIGNPLYHWTHLELRRYFNIDDLLTEKTAPSIWERANALLQTPELSVKGIFEKFNIFAVGTTDDPVDTLEHHRAIAEGTAKLGKVKTKVVPSFRPDRAMDPNSAGFSEYIMSLSQASGIKIRSFEDLLAALEKRLGYFIENGCRSSDHALEYAPYMEASSSQIEGIFRAAMAKKRLNEDEKDAFRTRMLISLAGLYAKRDVVMQLHFSSLRNINTNMFGKLGANTGYDAVHDCMQSKNLASLLDKMEGDREVSSLPKTVLYSLNPKDYYPLATVMGGFQNRGIEGKMQLGSAWWFCDHRDGMEEQMKVLANVGMFSGFIGMLTDSRSFLSYPRHEYFRRIMCNLIGKWVENGEYPADTQKLEKLVRDISFGNALRYFG